MTYHATFILIYISKTKKIGMSEHDGAKVFALEQFFANFSPSPTKCSKCILFNYHNERTNMGLEIRFSKQNTGTYFLQSSPQHRLSAALRAPSMQKQKFLRAARAKYAKSTKFSSRSARQVCKTRIEPLRGENARPFFPQTGFAVRGSYCML